MTFIISFLATKLSYSSDRLVKAESRRRVAAISHSLTATSDDAKRVFAKAKALLAREDATTGMYEITGTKLKPIAWGDEAVLLDMEYLNDVPPDVAPLLVAERVAQVRPSLQLGGGGGPFTKKSSDRDQYSILPP
ncbi:hypothetical protein DIPPA_20718 [Diplonema papillatum]|nr:hypothetical protein DIPPA_20718 [Diplonema papillatum]